MASVVLRILGDDRSLRAAVASANRSLGHLNNTANKGLLGIAALGLAFAGMGAAGIAAGAVAGAAVAGMMAGISGALVYFAAKNQEVRDSFTGLKEHVSTQMQQMTSVLHEPLKQFATQARGAFDALAPSLTRISTLLAPIITQIGEKLTPLAEKVGPMLESAFNAGTGPMMAMIDGLGPVTDGMKGFFDALNRPEVSAFVTQLMESFGQLLPILGEMLVTLAPLGEVALPILVEGMRSFADILDQYIIPTLSAVGGFLSEHPGLIYALVAAIAVIKVAIMAWNVVQAILNLTLLASPITWIILAVAALIAIIVLLVMNWETVSAKLGQIWDWIKNKASEVWNGIKDFFSRTWDSITEKVSSAWNRITEAISNGLDRAKNWVVNKFNEIISWIGSLPGRFAQAGRDLIQGLINGVGAMGGALAAKAREVAQGALNAIKSFFGINSPSRVMRQMGVFVGEGFVLGISAEEKAVADAAKALGTSAISEVEKASAKMSGMFANGFEANAQVQFSSEALTPRSTGVTYQLHVEAGISNPEETGRALVNAIRDFERLNGKVLA